MHVIIISDFAYVEGGATAVALASAVGLAQHGYKVTVFSAVGEFSDELVNSNINLISTNQYDILNNPSKPAAMVQGLWNAKSMREFHALLSKLDPSETIIHVHTWTKALSSSVISIALKLKFKIVITLHDYFIACPNGGFYNYKLNRICQKKGGSIGCLFSNCDSRGYSHKIWRYVRHLVQNNFAHIPSGINNFISLSQLSESILRRYVSQDAKIYRVRNPINVPKQSRVLAETNKTYIFVGRLSPEKGAVLFARAAKTLGITPTFVGDGVCQSEIKSILPEAIMTGWLDRKDVLVQLTNSRALIFPSQWYEAQGLVVQEANALGIPCIVSNCNAGRESVNDGETGLLFDAESVDDLTAKLIKLNNDDLVSSMSASAYNKYWDSPPTLSSHIKELEVVYNSILNN